MNDNKKFYIIYVLSFLMFAATIFNLYMIYNLRKELSKNTLVLTDSINTLNIDTQGKIDNLKKDTNSKLANIKNTTINNKEIVYVPKESQEDADIELKNQKSRLTVKVNDGTRYSMDLLPTESHKFEDGKLLISQGFSSDINIRAYEPKRSQWSFSTAMNADKDVMGGIHYNLTDSLAASVYVGHGIKPYYGVTMRIGGNK